MMTLLHAHYGRYWWICTDLYTEPNKSHFSITFTYVHTWCRSCMYIHSSHGAADQTPRSLSHLRSSHRDIPSIYTVCCIRWATSTSAGSGCLSGPFMLEQRKNRYRRKTLMVVYNDVIAHNEVTGRARCTGLQRWQITGWKRPVSPQPLSDS